MNYIRFTLNASQLPYLNGRYTKMSESGDNFKSDISEQRAR